MRHSITLLTALSAAIYLPLCVAEDLHFPIHQFIVQGNTLLPETTITAITQAHTGESQVYGDIQKTLEQVENAYHQAGYGAVQVYVPEQYVSTGMVQLNVIESKIGNIVPDISKHFDRDNILNSLPTLQAEKSPNTRDIADNVQLVNENPAKKVEVVLGMGEKKGTVDANIKMKEEDPVSVVMTVDNTGNAATGQSRAGVTLTNANMFNKDQVAAVSYVTSLEKPSQVQIMSLGYHVPIFSLNDSADLIIGHSDVNAGTTSIPGGQLGFSGSGNVASMRYNHNLTRHGEYSHKVIASIDQKDYNNTCTINGLSNACGSAGESISVQPIGITYAGTLIKPGLLADFNLGVSQNIGGSAASQFDKVLPNRNAARDYSIQRIGVNILSLIGQSDWQWRLAMQTQRSDSALIPGEQIGLAGVSTLRGLSERQLAADTGTAITAEIYTPDLSNWLGANRGNLRLLAFVDSVSGQNNQTSGASLNQLSATSTGIGARYNYTQDWAVKLDMAQLQAVSAKDANNNAYTPITALNGDTRIHASLMVKF
jgi:hemolysin activation/secretion protein